MAVMMKTEEANPDMPSTTLPSLSMASAASDVDSASVMTTKTDDTVSSSLATSVSAHLSDREDSPDSHDDLETPRQSFMVPKAAGCGDGNDIAQHQHQERTQFIAQEKRHAEALREEQSERRGTIVADHCRALDEMNSRVRSISSPSSSLSVVRRLYILGPVQG